MQKSIFIIFILLAVSCGESGGGIDYTVDHRPVWINMDTFHYSDTSIYDISMIISFYYPVEPDEKFKYRASIWRKNYATSGEFKIGDSNNIKPFSEWQKCSIKLPPDTTKNWLFRFEGEIPKNLSILYDTLNSRMSALVFWDSVDNTKYYFEKRKE